jgi:hypothetical protein
MKYRFKILIVFLGCIFTWGVWAMSYYKVQAGDTLSDISYRFLGEKVYGPKGGLAKLLLNNPHIKNPDLIYLGQKVLIKKQGMRTELKTRAEKIIIPDQKKQQEEKSNQQGMYLSLFSGFASLSSVDVTSGVAVNAVSDMGYGATVVWSHHWSETLKYFAVGSVKSFKFKMGEGRSLLDASGTQSYFGTGITYKLGKHSYSLGLGLGESFILNSVSGGTEFSIKKASIPSVSLSGLHPLAYFKSGFNFSLGWRAGYMLAAEQDGYSTKGGDYFSLNFGSNYDLSGTILNIQTSYTQREIEVGSADQSSKEFGINIGVGWSF